MEVSNVFVLEDIDWTKVELFASIEMNVKKMVTNVMGLIAEIL
jgi:hypothetical protein